jgi:hypothetical protein
METLLPIIIQAISGMVGGGVAGTFIKQAATTLLPKLIAGGIGGIGGGMLLNSVLGGDGAMAMDMSKVIGDIVGGLVGGGVLTSIAGAVLNRR